MDIACPSHSFLGKFVLHENYAGFIPDYGMLKYKYM